MVVLNKTKMSLRAFAKTEYLGNQDLCIEIYLKEIASFLSWNGREMIHWADMADIPFLLYKGPSINDVRIF